MVNYDLDFFTFQPNFKGKRNITKSEYKCAAHFCRLAKRTVLNSPNFNDAVKKGNKMFMDAMLYGSSAIEITEESTNFVNVREMFKENDDENLG